MPVLAAFLKMNRLFAASLLVALAVIQLTAPIAAASESVLANERDQDQIFFFGARARQLKGNKNKGKKGGKNAKSCKDAKSSKAPGKDAKMKKKAKGGKSSVAPGSKAPYGSKAPAESCR